MADTKLSKGEKLDTLRAGDSVSLDGSVIATDVAGADTGEIGSRYYTKMKYQEKQFLRAADFKAEQEYHTRKLRDHNKALHTYGVSEGLVTSKPSDDFYAGCVEVSIGSAIDIDGNSMILDSPEIVDLAKACLNEDGTYKTPVKLFISFGVTDASDPKYNVDEGGFAGCTRIVEKPEFFLCAEKDNLDSKHLILADIDRDRVTGAIGKIRKPVGWQDAGVKQSVLESVDLPDNIIEGRHIKNGVITASKLGSSSVNELKIDSEAVSEAKLARGAVSETKLAANAVTADKIANGVVSEAKLAPNAVSATKIAANAVTADKIANGVVSEAKLATNSVTAIKIANETITSSKLVKNSITSHQLANAAVNNGAIQSGAVTIPKTSMVVKNYSGVVPTTGTKKYTVTVVLTSDQVTRPSGVAVFPMQPNEPDLYGPCYPPPAGVLSWYAVTARVGDGGRNVWYERRITVTNNSGIRTDCYVTHWLWK